MYVDVCSMEKTSPKTVMDLSNEKFHSDRKEHAIQRENYADLVSRILVDNILRHINPLEKFSTSSEVPQNHNDLPSIRFQALPP